MEINEPLLHSVASLQASQKAMGGGPCTYILHTHSSLSTTHYAARARQEFLEVFSYQCSNIQFKESSTGHYIR